jgi:hypothetical protein
MISLKSDDTKEFPEKNVRRTDRRVKEQDNWFVNIWK